MNNPQFWGALRGTLIAIGGMLASVGLITAADWAKVVDHGIGIASGIVGLAMIVWPMIRSWRSRSAPELARQAVETASGQVIEELAASPSVIRIVAASDNLAASIASPKVVGPQAP